MLICRGCNARSLNDIIFFQAEKYEGGIFGTCPRVYCVGCNVVPCGRLDIPGTDTVKLFCPNCNDVYVPPSSRFQGVDGQFNRESDRSMLTDVSCHRRLFRNHVCPSFLSNLPRASACTILESAFFRRISVVPKKCRG